MTDIRDRLMREMDRRDAERDGWNVALGDSLPMPMAGTYEKRAAGRAPTFSGDVLVPLSQALVCAGAGAIIGGLLFRNWQAAGVAGALAFVGAWLLLLASTRQLLYAVERLTRHDLNNDGDVGPPAAALAPVILHAPQRPHDASGPPERPETRDVSDPNRRLALDLAEFVTQGDRDGFALRLWTGRQLGTGTTVTDGKWREWTGYLKTAAILKSDRGGTRLTVPVDEALKSILHDWRGR